MFRKYDCSRGPHSLADGKADATNGPSWDQVTKYLLIHLLDLRRSGWQVQSVSGRKGPEKAGEE
jgi:hypothetical protein